MSYRVSELEELRMLLGKRHRSAEDIAVVFEIMLKRCAESGMDCRNCPLCFDDDEVFLCTLMKRYAANYRGRNE